MAKIGKGAARTETVGVRVDPKVRYLAEIAAREQQRSVSSFIEWAIRKILTEGSPSIEPGTGPMIDPTKQPKPMWGDGLWDVDEADRFFLLATMRSDLLTISEQRLWKLFHLGNPTQDKNIATFREFWNSPSIDTTHLKAESMEVA
ncbi:hypothetical protein [Acidicapsa acidisoli]|uniref:hypothetical protein n=1 Tax=Acidicapsa acidisoli TaxID=1615681 RepID=UPI0021E02C20|nr:hypothetical protein [Acidicapsa acidisoli]